MRKYIIGGLIGFMLATAASANAEGVTKLIDQVVQGVFPVTVEGTSIGEAVVIDNKTYLPVREFGEAVGYKVTFTEDREVVLTRNSNATTTVPGVPIVNNPVGAQGSAQEQIATLKRQVADLKLSIETGKKLKLMNEESLKNPKTPQDEIKKLIAEIDADIAANQAKLSNLESQLAALEAQQ